MDNEVIDLNSILRRAEAVFPSELPIVENSDILTLVALVREYRATCDELAGLLGRWQEDITPYDHKLWGDTEAALASVRRLDE